MAYYNSLREYLEALDKAGELITITTPINKDTQLAPLVRLQFRGLPEEQRKGFLFTNVFDSRGKKYDIPVAMGVLGASTKVVALSLQCQPEETNEKLAQAWMHPIKTKLVEKGPVQAVVYKGDSLLEKGGLDEFPVPISTPGYDAGPHCSAPCWVTKDPDTGIRNVGIYRSLIMAQDRMGIHLGELDADLTVHWQKCRARGIPLQVAIVHGGPPNLTNVGASSIAYGVDEYTVAGAIAGQAVEMVKCKTVDLEVPANADVVIEGEMSTAELEMEGPHGESIGYMDCWEMQPYLTVTCITHRKDPIWQTILSQLPRSENTKRGQVLSTAMLYKRYKYDLAMSSVLQVANPETGTGRTPFIIIQLKMHTDQEEVWRALEAASGASIAIAVDDDIDPWHPDQFWFAIGTRTLLHRDIKIIRHKVTSRITSNMFLPTEEMIKTIRHQQFDPTLEVPFETSTMLINATLKWDYAPVSLPTKEFMEEALGIWQKEGLPALKLEEPWYGYELGYWPKEFAEAAARAVKGEYFKTSKIRAKERVKVDYPTIKPEGER